MSSNGSATAEAEAEMSPTVSEMLVPPVALLAGISASLLIWVLLLRCKAKRYPPLPTFSYGDDEIECGQNSVAPNGTLFVKSFSSLARDKDQVHIKSKHNDNNNIRIGAAPLFQSSDKEILAFLQGKGPIMFWPLMHILTPVIFSLGFCPMTLLLAEPISSGLWPSDMYATKPNINDAIGCFLVPAGMVYAISFGFAFQQVIESFREVEVDIEKRADRLERILVLVNQLTCVGAITKVKMLRIVKDDLTSATMMSGRPEKECKHKLEDLDSLLRILYSSQVQEAMTRNDNDLWLKSVYKRLEKITSDDDGLTAKLSKSRIHPLQWSFLQTLGYFTFLGVLLIDAASYRANLSMCIITVLSISLLCYVVSDLDSPFNGVFLVSLDGFCEVIGKLNDSFDETLSESDMRKTVGTTNAKDITD